MIFHIPNRPSILELESVTEKNGRRFYTLPDGNKAPSITTILSYFKKDAIQKWRNRVGEAEANRISKTASGRGTNVHSLVEKYLYNDSKYELGAFPDAIEMFQSIKSHVDKINNVHYQECSLYSPTLVVAGRTDIIAEYDGVLSIIDIKTSAKPKKEEWIEDYFIQECFYALAYQELGGPEINQLVTIMGVDHHKPQIYIEKTKDWIAPLVKKVKQYKKENK